jgi:hypothetical protein
VNISTKKRENCTSIIILSRWILNVPFR